MRGFAFKAASPSVQNVLQKNMNRILTITFIFLFSICSHAYAEDSSKLYKRFENGNFFPQGPVAVSGWDMKSENGKSYHRALLNCQVDEVVKHGRDAFKVSFQYLDHSEMYMRYIAAKSLMRITKRDPTWYYFGTPGKEFNGNKTWSDDAKKEWMDWFKSTEN